MKVSFCVIAYNEEKTIESLFSDIRNQNYPHELIEVILVDGNSEDNTKNIMKKFSEEKNGFEKVLVLDNPKRKQASGWNVAISNSNGDIIIRIDAHASVPRDFVSKNVACIKSGEYICGGQRPNIIDEKTPWKETLLIAETSMFGSSIAPYRRNIGKVYVKSMFHAAYRKEVFEKVGLFNENLGRTEDNEIHYRMRKAGYKLCFDSDIISYQHTRTTLLKMLKQKYGNGYWVGLTMGICPKCLSIFHFVPAVFVMSILGSIILSIIGFEIIGIVLGSLYLSLAIIMSILSTKNKRVYIYTFSLPIIFFLLHVSYGVGTIIGMINIPFGYIKNKNSVLLNSKGDIYEKE